MIPAEIPESEKLRLQTLQEYDVLDTIPEPDLDDITELAAYICDAPTALISLIDSDRQWFKSRKGLDVSETPREIAFCSHAILQHDVMIVPNAKEDKRFKDNPLVTGDLHLRFYAGAPLEATNGENIGTLCILDYEPRELSKDQKNALEVLSKQVMMRLEVRKNMQFLRQKLIEETEKRMHSEMASKVAEESAKAKSEFLALMSHEIRTPLNAVLGFSDLLATQISDSTHLQYLETINHAGKGLLQLINEILDLSKIESNKMGINNSPVNLRDLGNDISNLFEAQMIKQELEWKLIISDDLPHSLLLDEHRLKQIVINLVGNALKFTSEGKIELSFKHTINVDDDSKVDLSISVSDTGVGIEQAALDKIFRAFEQGDNSISRKYGGTGLGLTIAKQLISLMNGSIEVESVEGSGSNFTVKIPDTSISIISADKKPLYSRTSSVNKFENRVVLVVDDVASNRFLVREWLEFANFTVLEAENGKAALEMIEIHTPDIILMDIRMPVMDGFAATRRIKSSKRSKHIPVIALTASITNDDMDESAESGFDLVLTKPVMSDQFFEALHKVIPETHSFEDINEGSDASYLNSKSIQELESLVVNLKENIIPSLEELSSVFMVASAERTALEIVRLSNDHNFVELKDIGNTIFDKTQEFDIRGVTEGLEKIKGLLTKLEQSLDHQQ